MLFLAEHDREGGKKILEGREALLTIDDMEGVDAYEALSLLGSEHGGAQEMGRRLIASKPDVGIVRVTADRLRVP